MQISVVICTHNPREDYLRRTLESLRVQTLPNETWELLLIDNASERPLAQVLNLSWHPQARCVRENQMGLTPARLLGIRESRGDLVVFIDDDNVLASDYLEKALTIQKSHSFLGAFGAGVLEPEFEEQPAPRVSGLLSLLALRSVTAPAWSSRPADHKVFPWGAGLCAVRAVADHYLEFVERLTTVAVLDRRGDALFCGGDDLFSWAATGLGYSFGIFPELKITHLISARRVDPDYLLRLVHDHSFSHGILHYLLSGTAPTSTSAARQLRFLLHALRRGKYSMRCHQATARGEAAALRFIREKNLRPLSQGGLPNESSLQAN